MKLVRSLVVHSETEGKYEMMDDHNLKKDVLAKLNATESDELEHIEVDNMRLFYTNPKGPVVAVRLSPKTGGNVSVPLRKHIEPLAKAVWANFEAHSLGSGSSASN